MRKKHYGFAIPGHKKATKCRCHRTNARLKNVVAKRPTDKKIAMMRKWKKDELGRPV